MKSRCVFCVIVAALAAGCSTNPVTGKRELILIPESQEIAMGEEAAPQFEKEFGGATAEPRLQDYVQSLGGKLAAASDREGMPWSFTLVNSDIPNAFALPGGKVFITAGLFGSLDNERQLAAVLGHEIGHVCAKHNVKGMQRQMGAEAFTKIVNELAGGKSSVQSAAKIVSSMAVLRYSRDDEYQADALGVRYMERAGHNPWGMVETLEFLQTLGGVEPGRFQEMFLTHPLTSKRIEAVKTKVVRDYARYSPHEGDSAKARFLEMRGLLQARTAK
jgi:predicted Zn-dependent protease